MSQNNRTAGDVLTDIIVSIFVTLIAVRVAVWIFYATLAIFQGMKEADAQEKKRSRNSKWIQGCIVGVIAILAFVPALLTHLESSSDGGESSGYTASQPVDDDSVVSVDLQGDHHRVGNRQAAIDWAHRLVRASTPLSDYQSHGGSLLMAGKEGDAVLPYLAIVHYEGVEGEEPSGPMCRYVGFAHAADALHSRPSLNVPCEARRSREAVGEMMVEVAVLAEEVSSKVQQGSGGT